MICQWYLFQVDLTSSARLNLSTCQPCYYYCVFLVKNLNNANKSNYASRWWPDWYRYTRDTSSGDIVFGTYTLFHPNVHLDALQYIQWADTAHLVSGETAMLGPFDFVPISPGNQIRNRVPLDRWVALLHVCSARRILPPTMGNALSFHPSPRPPHPPGRKWKRK